LEQTSACADYHSGIYGKSHVSQSFHQQTSRSTACLPYERLFSSGSGNMQGRRNPETRHQVDQSPLSFSGALPSGVTLLCIVVAVSTINREAGRYIARAARASIIPAKGSFFWLIVAYQHWKPTSTCKSSSHLSSAPRMGFCSSAPLVYPRDPFGMGLSH
jgi:hypothetical protein